MLHYELVVIGGGHAGIEAAWSASGMGISVCLITLSESQIGELSCNPSFGGIAKGNVVREIDALGGIMGYITDKAALSYKILNKRKGPAVQATRAQVDRNLYKALVQEELRQRKNLEIVEDEVLELIVESGHIVGVICRGIGEVRCKAVVIATGTFLNGLIHIGEEQIRAGRRGEQGAYSLSNSLANLGIGILRFKTGTPPRVYRSSVRLDKTEIQPGERDYLPFSLRTKAILKNQLPCFLTYTTPETHRLIFENLKHSALYSGRIKGRGPRYCPSIEDKVVRFADHPRHPVFIEPEGWNLPEFYLNGLSMSMPVNIQEEIVRSIPGLEEAVFSRPAYAIEYDCIDPRQLKHTLEHKTIRGLFFAGQINGSSGYEEAGGQGIIAGINAALYIEGKPEFVLGRDKSYIGVMIDDLVSRGVDEPYRLFTARAEHRLLLREDNAARRLIKYGRAFGLVGDEVFAEYISDEQAFEKEMRRIREKRIRANPKESVTIEEYLSMPGNSYETLMGLDEEARRVPEKVRRWVEIEVKYRGYIRRELSRIKGEKELESIRVPEDFDYLSLKGLTREGRERFTKLKPKNLLEASRIPGVRLSDITLLYIHLKRNVSYETSA